MNPAFAAEETSSASTNSEALKYAQETPVAELVHPSFAFFNDELKLTLDGYVAAAGTYERASHGHRQTSFFNSGDDFSDSMKLGLNLEWKSLTAYVSFFGVPSRDGGEFGVLDAYLTWKYDWREGYGVAVTAGKFTSYLGYEAFFPNERDFISYAPIAGIPGYQTGVRVDFNHGPLTLGAAIVDSLQQGEGFYRGDGSLRDVGFEVCGSLKLLEETLTLFVGLGVDTDHRRRTGHGLRGHEFEAAANLTLDIYAEYKATDRLTLAAEFSHAHNVADWSFLAQAAWQFTDEISSTVRLGGVEHLNGPRCYVVGVCPTWKPSPHFLLRGEATCQFVTGDSVSWFLGAQAVFSF